VRSVKESLDSVFIAFDSTLHPFLIGSSNYGSKFTVGMGIWKESSTQNKKNRLVCRNGEKLNEKENLFNFRRRSRISDWPMKVAHGKIEKVSE